VTNPSSGSEAPSWQPKLVYGMATVCLLLGLSVGYLLRGSESHIAAAGASASPSEPQPPKGSAPRPTLEQMKAMADKQVEPLLEKLKQDPKNKDLLLRVAYFYKAAHQFKEAAAYFDQLLQIDPRNVAVRTERASCLYYMGNVDGALDQLQQSLKLEPTDANSLFNLGMVRWQGKKDAAGAIAAWQQLLQTNPNHEKRAIVERMIADAQQPDNSN
jgi:cytochrome c-type biogenesis protein CcmH/NrfG